MLTYSRTHTYTWLTRAHTLMLDSHGTLTLHNIHKLTLKLFSRMAHTCSLTLLQALLHTCTLIHMLTHAQVHTCTHRLCQAHTLACSQLKCSSKAFPDSADGIFVLADKLLPPLASQVGSSWTNTQGSEKSYSRRGSCHALPSPGLHPTLHPIWSLIPTRSDR